MRIPALAILTFATILTAAPARAQTYDPAYPVCLHVYTRGANYYECRYTSLPQCNASASGRAAAPPSASSIHILLARKSPLIIGGITASTKTLLSEEQHRAAVFRRSGVWLDGVDPSDAYVTFTQPGSGEIKPRAP